MKYQYIGDAESPEKINFMGKYVFIKKGAYVEVEDERCLRKIAGISGFKLKSTEAKKAVKKTPKKAAKEVSED